MYCKKHDTSVATLECSVCGEHFCDLCNNGSSPFICTNCSEKNINDLTTDNEFNIKNLDESEVIEEELIESNFDDFNGALADNILNDILGSITIPDKAKVNFDPSDILSQIEAGLESEMSSRNELKVQEVDVFEQDNIEKIESVVAENVFNESLENSSSKIVLTKDTLKTDENNVSEVVVEALETDTVEQKVEFVDEQPTDKVSTVELLKSKFNSTKDLTMDKISSIDMTATKEKASVLGEETKTKASKLSEDAKVQASKLSEEAKIKSAAAAAYTAEKAKKVKTKTNEKMSNNKANLDETISKIQQANVNGEYDDLLNKFSTRYGQGAKADDDGSQSALPLKINNFLYFICSLIPGIAQFYLGLTKRGTTILVIASVFLFVTMTPSLYFITSILSFADAYKLRNIYYRGGLIEDTNKDISSFMKNKYIILLIIATVVINMFRAIFTF